MFLTEYTEFTERREKAKNVLIDFCVTRKSISAVLLCESQSICGNRREPSRCGRKIFEFSKKLPANSLPSRSSRSVLSVNSSEPGERVRNSFRFLLSILSLLTSVFLAGSALAQGPAWWYNRGAVDTGMQANDYAPITCGQLKWLATNAFCEMESCFGAGPAVSAVVGAFSNTKNYYPANIGQIKHVAQPFYDRLYELNLTNTFPANIPGYYPWSNSSETNDYALANIGQAKYVFSFDSAKDSDGDGLSDWWEVAHGTDPYDPDTDGDGLSDSWELAHGYDPLDENDGNVAIVREAARQKIIRHWMLFYGTAPVFTNTPGSQADLIDMRNALNALSGKFYKKD